MRRFYKQIQFDKMSMRFYAACPICGNRYYAGKPPLLCRSIHSLERLEQGNAGRLRQFIYTKYKASIVTHFTRYFNFCCFCGKWVCDDCYGDEFCITCKANKGGD